MNIYTILVAGLILLFSNQSISDSKIESTWETNKNGVVHKMKIAFNDELSSAGKSYNLKFFKDGEIKELVQVEISGNNYYQLIDSELVSKELKLQVGKYLLKLKHKQLGEKEISFSVSRNSNIKILHSGK